MSAPPGRLIWLCRRGHRELDILLSRFMHDHYPTLPVAEQKVFEQLLQEADVDILAWLTGRKPPPSHLAAIIDRLPVYQQPPAG